MYNFRNVSVAFISLCLLCISCDKADPFGPGRGQSTQPTTPADTTAVGDTLVTPNMATLKTWLVDKDATDQTAALFFNLKKTAQTNILFGHQDDTKRGYNWANEEGQTYQPLNSDVKEVTGSYPSVYGSDFNHVTSWQWGNWFDYEQQTNHDLMVDAYNRGGVVTFCWHYGNPVSKGSFYWDQSPVEAVSKIIPGGDSVAVFKESLKRIADFAKSLVGADGKLVPVIFRPWHEFDGDWFWWGKAHCTADQYKSLYQFTVSYLRDSLGVHNFLYAWSPDKNFTTQAEYLDRYPGDDFIDLVGTDNYGDMDGNTAVSVASNKFKIVSDYAKSKNKVAALTETGLGNLGKSDWFTKTLLAALKNQKVELAYVLLWANTKDNFYTPYKGQAAESDFVNFGNDAYVLFGNKTPAMYTLP